MDRITHSVDTNKHLSPGITEWAHEQRGHDNKDGGMESATQTSTYQSQPGYSHQWGSNQPAANIGFSMQHHPSED